MKRGLEQADGYQNPSKRLKVTPVVFFWKLPASVTEQKVRDFCHPFGDIKESLFFEKKSQALVEMASIDAARSLVERYKNTQPKIDGFNIQLEFSRNKDHITPKFDNRAGYESSENNGEWGSCHVIVAKSDGIDRSTTQEDLINLMAESRLDPHDYKLTKTLVIFKKGIAFIEFMSPGGAFAVWKALKELKVYLNNYSVKFMKGEREFLEGGDEIKDYPSMYHGRHRRRPSPPRHFDDLSPGIPRDIIEDARSIGIPLEALIMVPCVKTRDGPMIFEEYYAKKLQSMDRRRGYDDPRDMPSSRRGERYSPQRHLGSGGRVVMITGIMNALCDCDKLQTLCGAFGDVQRTKLSFKNRDIGFVEMMDPEGARIAVQHLKGLQIYDRPLELKVARMRELQGRPNEMNEDKEILTKDYHRSGRNRYSDRNLRRNINPPGLILHISNINLKAVNEVGKREIEQELSSMFGDKEVCFLQNLDTQLFCLAGSVEESVRILVEFHLEEFHGRPLRISFSARETMPDREE